MTGSFEDPQPGCTWSTRSDLRLFVAGELFDGARDARLEVETFRSVRGERHACRLVAPTAHLGLAGWVGWPPSPASDSGSAQRQLSVSRMSRSLRAKASGWPAYPNSPPTKPPWWLGNTLAC